MAEIKREDIRLSVDGALYGGWKEAQVVRSIEQGALAFTLKVTEKWQGQPTRRVIRPGAACTLSASGDDLLTGHVDDVTTDYDTDQHTVTIVGRDKVGDLVDCAAMVDGSFEFANLSLLNFASIICQPYGVHVIAEADVGAPFARFAVQPGETAWAAIERACRHRALLPNGDGKGGLVLTRAGRSGRASGTLQLGYNVKIARGTFSYRDRFSLTVVRGQQEGADWLDGTQITGPEGRAKDGTISRYRPTVIIAEQAGNGLTLQERAQWEVRVARGRSRNVVYTVAGWRDDGGQLWRPNTMVMVKDDYLDIDFEMLVVAVTFAMTLDGSTTELQLSLPDAYDLLPEPDDASPGTGLWEGR
jgi:prophage tail gpP-like protein